MERRALLAALLSAVVLVVWYSLFGPQERRVREPLEAGPAAVETAGAAESPSAGGTAELAVQAKPEISAHDEQEIEIASSGVRAVVSSRGGVIRSLVLPGYKDEAGQALELLGATGPRPLEMVSSGPWNDALYAVEKAVDAVTLRWSDGQGNWVEKVVAAGRGTYGLEVAVRGGGAPMRDGVVVSAGIRQEEQGKKGGFARSGAVVGVAGKVKRVDTVKLKSPESFAGGLQFAGVEDQYFLVTLLPDDQGAQAIVDPTHGVVVQAGAGGVGGTLFAGAKEHQTLKGYGRGLEGTISFGLFGVLSVGFLAVMRWIYSWAANWGVAIILLTAAIRVLLFPLTHKSTVAMRRMQVLQPKMKAIQDRYKERAKRDPQVRQRMNQEVMQLYKTEGVNPMGGCLPTLVQLPILWALYTLFAYAIELRHAPFVLWIHDLAAKDPTYVTPILMTASMVLQQRMAPQTGDPAQRRMFMMLPFVFGLMFMNFPAGLVLYWLVNNLLTIGQQIITNRLLSRSTQG